MRHVFIAAATGGAVIMTLLTIVLLVLGWLSRPAARPKRQVAPPPTPKLHLVPVAEPDELALPVECWGSSLNWLIQLNKAFDGTIRLRQDQFPVDLAIECLHNTRN